MPSEVICRANNYIQLTYFFSNNNIALRYILYYLFKFQRDIVIIVQIIVINK